MAVLHSLQRSEAAMMFGDAPQRRGRVGFDVSWSAAGTGRFIVGERKHRDGTQPLSFRMPGAGIQWSRMTQSCRDTLTGITDDATLAARQLRY
jgi:hypothetical protein